MYDYINISITILLGNTGIATHHPPLYLLDPSQPPGQLQCTLYCTMYTPVLIKKHLRDRNVPHHSEAVEVTCHPEDDGVAGDWCGAHLALVHAAVLGLQHGSSHQSYLRYTTFTGRICRRKSSDITLWMALNLMSEV